MVGRSGTGWWTTDRKVLPSVRPRHCSGLAAEVFLLAPKPAGQAVKRLFACKNCHPLFRIGDMKSA